MVHKCERLQIFLLFSIETYVSLSYRFSSAALNSLRDFFINFSRPKAKPPKAEPFALFNNLNPSVVMKID